MRRYALTLFSALAIGACSFDWDDLDLRGEASSTADTTTTTSAGGGGAGGSNATGGGGMAPAPWFDPGLSRRRPLTASGVGSALADFPVLVVLDDTRIDYDAAAVDGSDLRFEAEGQVLAHDVDHWEPGAVSTIWVRLPSLEAGAAFTMYYGGVPSTDAVASSQTWSANYLAVWHLDDDGVDATGNGHDGTPENVNAVPGFVGLAYDFELVGTSKVVIPGNLPTATAFVSGGTVSAIVQARSLGANGKGRILERGGNTSFAGGWGFTVSNTQANTFAFGHDYDMNFGYWLSPPNTVVFDTWQHAAVTANVTDQTVVHYLDGAPLAENIFQMGTVAPEAVETHMTTIGARINNVSRNFDGIIDEVRLSSVARTPAWLDAEAKAARDELLTYGSEETRPR